MRAYRVGIAGPVGSGKTALVDQLTKKLWPRINLGVVTNDIYTKEDAEFLMRQGTLPLDRIRGVETGGCPHAAIREDASMNIEAIGEIFNMFNAINPAFGIGAASSTRFFTGTLASHTPNPVFLKPIAYAGDAGQSEQRIGQIGFRFSF